MTNLQTLRSQYQTAQAKMEALYERLESLESLRYFNVAEGVAALKVELEKVTKVCDELFEAIESEENALRIGAYYPLCVCVWI
jgi:predicted nuclease with TOPRIM domain